VAVRHSAGATHAYFFRLVVRSTTVVRGFFAAVRFLMYRPEIAERALPGDDPPFLLAICLTSSRLRRALRVASPYRSDTPKANDRPYAFTGASPPSHLVLSAYREEGRVARKARDPDTSARKEKNSIQRSSKRTNVKATVDGRSRRREGAAMAQRGRRLTRAESLALAASRRVGNRRLQVRLNFIEATGEDPPPLARLLRGGRGGTVRLKLYLTMLWMAAGEPHDITFPARAWAELLDLPSPEGNGDRRVRDAIDWLEHHGFVSIQRQPGRPATITLLREDGSRRAYVVPAAAPKDQGTKKIGDEHWHVRLPAIFWVNGWMVALSGTAVAILLVMLVLERQSRGPRLWISPAEARRRFALSEDTWTKGTAELRKHGLLVVGRRPISEEFGWRRVRNTYSLDLDELQRRAPGWR
jgi:hypothetical protein